MSTFNFFVEGVSSVGDDDDDDEEVAGDDSSAELIEQALFQTRRKSEGD